MANTKTQFTSNIINMGLVVSDLEKSLRFYQDVLGMVEVPGFSINADFAKRSGLTGGIPFEVKILQTTTKDQITQYKIMSFKKPKAWFWKWKHHFIQRGLGIRYITLIVDELDPILEQMKKHQIKALGSTPTPLQLGDQTESYLLIQDPDGVFIEVIAPQKS